MIVDHFERENFVRSQQRYSLHFKITTLDVTDVLINDIMSVPLSHLCQLAWPLLEGNYSGTLGISGTLSAFSRTCADDAQLREFINATVAETVSLFRVQCWWGELTCHMLRLALFQKVLDSMLVTDVVVPSEQSTEIVSCTVFPQVLQKVGVEEGYFPGIDDATNVKAQNRSLNCCLTNDRTGAGEEYSHREKRAIGPVSWVLPYIAGQQDEKWLLKKVQEIVSMGILPQNENHKQFVSDTAYISVYTQTDRRFGRVLLYILREVLQRWEAALDTTGEASVLGFSVVLPILNIARCTKFAEDEMKAVGKLLCHVRFPSRSGDLDHAYLSSVTFTTSYSFSLEANVESENEDEETASRLPAVSTPLSILSSLGVIGDTSVLLGRFPDMDDGDDATTSMMVTDVFLVAPLALKVSVHIRKALYCDGVQIVLVPRASTIMEGNDGGSDEVSTEPVWFRPREGETHELTGGCDAIVRYKRVSESPVVPILSAEVRLETSLKVDGRWMVEFRNSLSGAQLVVASSLVQRMKNGFSSELPRLCEKAMVLLRNGFISEPQLCTLPQFVLDILHMDEETLRRRVPCLRSDVRGVRAALSLIGAFIAHCEPEELLWESVMWREVIKRVSLASMSLGRNTRVMEVSTYVLENVAPFRLSMSQIVEGTISLLTSSITVSELHTILKTQHERAELCVLALSLLLRAKEEFMPGEMFHVVSLLREIMMCEDGHYLQRFYGCGELLEEEIRDLVHQLLAIVFKKLHGVMSLPETERRKHVPHRFLWDTDEFGPFALVALSLLASPLDARDMDFLWRRVSIEVQGLFPNFTDFTRSTSFSANDVEENNILETLRALLENSGVDYSGSDCGADSVYIETEVNQLSIGFTMSGATERALGVWMPVGRERICSTCTPIYTPRTMLSSFCYFSSSLPLFLSSSSLVLLPSFCVAEVQLLFAPIHELVVALATESRTTLTIKEIYKDPEGFYFFPQSGTLHHNHRVISLPPLLKNESLAFCFYSFPKTSTRMLMLLVNRVRFAEFRVPQREFFFLAGVVGTASLRTNSFRVSFRLHKDMPLSSTMMEGGSNVTFSSFPTRYSISMFATDVFFHFISFCARRVAQFHSQLEANGTPKAICSKSSCRRLNVFLAEEAWEGFLDGCCHLLRQNVEGLVDSIKCLPPLSDIDDVTGRVKRNAILFIYHRFLRNYMTMIRIAVCKSSSSVDMFSTLAKVVCCEDIGERERCLALTIVHSLLREPYRVYGLGTYSPTQLWKCCCSLSRHVTALGYKPVFTSKSVPEKIVVCSGGRRIKFLTASDDVSRPMQNTSSFASQGIPLDGSLGDVVSFSVRLQRACGFDTLGRYYFVGVACPYPASTVRTITRHPGDRQDMAYVYAITDYFTDISYLTARLELQRHAQHWMSNEENIIFGSGDVITVTVNTKLRCLSFERNGMPLGTLFTGIPSMVNVLFPFVELFNKDASAVWIHMPREIGIRARRTMRDMLYHWSDELMPRLKQMLEADDVVALEVLGADGDEMAFCYRYPPRSEVKGSCVVRFLRQVESKAEVILEGSFKTFIVPAMALEPNYDEIVSKDRPVPVVIDDLIRIVSASLKFTSNTLGNRSIEIHPTKIFVSALRLLSEMDLRYLLPYDADVRRDLLGKLIRVLQVLDETSYNSQYIMSEAWNELVLLPDDDELIIPICEDRDNCDVADREKKNDTEDVADFCLRCPNCDEDWGNCVSEDHVAPHSLCFTLHCVLKRLGIPSSFTGFASEWFLEREDTRIKLHAGVGSDIEGEGEDMHGIFTFTGNLLSSNFMRGRCVYRCVEKTLADEVIDGEWACEMCTFINLSDSTRCAMCSTARPGATWACMMCGYIFNSKNYPICMTCGHRRAGGTEASSKANKKRAYCEGCGKQREYTTFDIFHCYSYCEFCKRIMRWFPEEKHIALVEAMLTGAGDTMEWMVIFGNNTEVYSNLRTSSYSFESLQKASEAALHGASDLSRYVPPLMPVCLNSSESLTFVVATQQQQQRPKLRAVVLAILLFCNRIVCQWSPELAPHWIASRDVLCSIRVLDENWLRGFEKIPVALSRGIFYITLRILFAGTSNEQLIKSVSSISRFVMKHNSFLVQKRHYLLYALCLSAIRCSGNLKVREVCYAALNALLEDSCGQRLNVQCLRDVVTITPVVAGQQQLMVHASLRGVNMSIDTSLASTSWLIKAVERMERLQRLPALFDEESPDIFPYLVELQETRMGYGGELIVGQVRGSVGVFAGKGRRYYYEVVIPENFGKDRSNTIIMGWGTLQHEVLGSGHHVGSDIHSWGFNCQDRICMLTGEQTMPTLRPIVSGDVIGALLNLETMMMCWSVNGEQLMWVAVSTQGKGEAIYPFVSASTDSQGVVVRLGHTQFKPEGFEDFSSFSYEMAQRESDVEPRSYEFYLQLSNLGNDMVNCGFTADSLIDTTVWFEHAQSIIRHYPLLDEETMTGKKLKGLWPYFRHLRSINALAVSVAKNNEMFSDSSYLMQSYQKVRQLLFFNARWAIVERQIDRRLIRCNLRRYNEILIDLNLAKTVAENCEKLSFMTLFEGTITGQLFRQTKDADIYLDSVMFVINLTGEVADDAGGVTRSVVTMMCDELNYCEQDEGMRSDPILPFFKLTSHTTMVSVVPNVDFYREHPERRQLFKELFTWLGKLLGNATLSGYLMFSLTFPRLVWKFLTFEELTIEDYHADIDDTMRGALNDDEFLLDDELFYAIPGVKRDDSNLSDSMPMSRSCCAYSSMTPVCSMVDLHSFTENNVCEENTPATKRRKEAERALLQQYDELLLAIRSGMTSVIPAHSLRLIRWDDLQQRVCGNPGATAEDVISSLNLSLLSEELSEMLKKIVRDWSQKKRSQFLLFCSGQRRIPLPEKVQVSCGDDPNAIPTAHTCSPISLLLQPYASVSVMREKLEVCLRHMYEFGFA